MNFSQRVTDAAESVLQRDGAVGPLELLQQLQFLHSSHFSEWLRGSDYYENIESQIQCGEKKLRQTYQEFQNWVQANNLQPIEGCYLTRLRNGSIQRQTTVDGDPKRELFFRTQYRPANLPAAKLKRLEAKQQKEADLTVFEIVSDHSSCSQCGDQLSQGDYIFLELKQPLCLTCADLDQLEFLPSGDMALTRRSKKYSPLSAVVMRFNRSRKRYERQGILVAAEAIERAETECVDDAQERAERRKLDAVRRLEQDERFVAELTTAILAQYPSCPAVEAAQIAAHTAMRGSGRVGRSAAGRALTEGAVELAIRAWIRHQHTDYDSMLMQGVPRQEARQQISVTLEKIVKKWQQVAPQN